MKYTFDLKFNNCVVDELNYRIATLKSDLVTEKIELKETIRTNVNFDFKLRKDFKKLLVIGEVNVKTYLMKAEFRQMSFRFHCFYSFKTDIDFLRELNNAPMDKKRAVVNEILSTFKVNFSEMIMDHINYTIFNIAKALGFEINIEGHKHKKNVVLTINVE